MRRWGDVVRELWSEINKITPVLNQCGMALLITVMTLSLLVAVTLQFHKTVWHKYLVANNSKLGSQLKTIADSGVNIALALIEGKEEGKQHDSLLDSWASLENETFSGHFPAGTLQLNVADLSGRFQINSLVQPEDNEQGGDNGDSDTIENELQVVFTRLLLSGSFSVEDEGEARSIVGALVDWIDEDDRESDHGAESSYYQSLENAHSSRNGPVQYIEELLLVKGITPALLFGTGEKEGLADYLTTYGNDGKINMNTAPVLVIKSLHSLASDELVQRLDEFRREQDSEDRLGQSGWYKDINGWPDDIEINEKMLTTQSTYFLITATGTFDTFSRRMVAVAERGDDHAVNLLMRKVE